MVREPALAEPWQQRGSFFGLKESVYVAEDDDEARGWTGEDGSRSQELQVERGASHCGENPRSLRPMTETGTQGRCSKSRTSFGSVCESLYKLPLLTRLVFIKFEAVISCSVTTCRNFGNSSQATHRFLCEIQTRNVTTKRVASTLHLLPSLLPVARA